MNKPSPLLRVQALNVELPTKRRAGRPGPGGSLSAVRDVSFDLYPGQILGIVGESGCGKTTLSRALVSLVPVTSGQVLFRGQLIGTMTAAELRQARREMQYIFQDPLAALSPRRTVAQALLEPIVLYGIGTAADRSDRLRQMVEMVGLDSDVLRRLPHELSGGQQQRVALARALVAEPSLIIADEPLSSLDMSVQARIMQLILDVRARQGAALLLISHNLAVIQQLADVVGVMYLGELVELAPAGQLFSAPAHPYTRALLDSVALADPARHRERTWLKGEPPSALTPPPGCVFHTRCPQVLAQCATIKPATRILGKIPADPQNHTVRCHLWNS